MECCAGTSGEALSEISQNLYLQTTVLPAHRKGMEIDRGDEHEDFIRDPPLASCAVEGAMHRIA